MFLKIKFFTTDTLYFDDIYTNKDLICRERKEPSQC